MEANIPCRVLLHGAGYTGKSSIIDTVLNGFEYREKEYYPSAGVLGNQVNRVFSGLGGGRAFTLYMTEFAGQYLNPRSEHNLRMAMTRYEKNDFILLTYDKTRRKTFEQLTEWVACLPKILMKGKVVYVLGCYSDVSIEEAEADMEVSEEEAKRFARRINA